MCPRRSLFSALCALPSALPLSRVGRRRPLQISRFSKARLILFRKKKKKPLTGGISKLINDAVERRVPARAYLQTRGARKNMIPFSVRFIVCFILCFCFFFSRNLPSHAKADCGRIISIKLRPRRVKKPYLYPVGIFWLVDEQNEKKIKGHDQPLFFVNHSTLIRCGVLSFEDVKTRKSFFFLLTL